MRRLELQREVLLCRSHPRYRAARALPRFRTYGPEPQVFDLLIYLMENRDRVVSKDDLIASVWGGRDRIRTSRL